MGLGEALDRAEEDDEVARRPDPRSRQHLLRRRRPQHARQRVPRHDEQLGEDRPGLRPHVRSRVQPRQADDRRRRGLRGRRRLRADRSPATSASSPTRRGSATSTSAARCSAAPGRSTACRATSGCARPRSSCTRASCCPARRRGVGPGQRVRAVRPARPGGRRLRRADARQERVHDAHHEARGQPRPRRRHRDADRAREHDLQRRPPVRGRQGRRAGLPREARPGLEARARRRPPAGHARWTSAFDDTTLELRSGACWRSWTSACTPRRRASARRPRSADDPWGTPPVLEELKAEARRRGLWNLFLPRTHEYGAGLTNLQYAPLAEITGRNPWIAPGGDQLLGARHRQHGAAVAVRDRGAAGSAGWSRCSTGRCARRSR